jgi:two-component system, OmpR family, response regulator
MRVLVAEDDLNVCEMLKLFFEREGFAAVFVHDGEEAIRRWEKEAFDLIILDWMLPKKSGIEVCKWIRSKSQSVPILLLTARTAEADQVLGFDLGADDYVTKPFRPLALIARMKALLRRVKQNSQAESSSASKLVIDEERHEVRYQGEVIKGITPREFQLLSLMSRYPKRVFTRDELLERVWGMDYYVDERTVDAQVKRLRKKLAPTGRTWIETVRGVGYRFVEDEDA